MQSFEIENTVPRPIKLGWGSQRRVLLRLLADCAKTNFGLRWDNSLPNYFRTLSNIKQMLKHIIWLVTHITIHELTNGNYDNVVLYKYWYGRKIKNWNVFSKMVFFFYHSFLIVSIQHILFIFDINILDFLLMFSHSMVSQKQHLGVCFFIVLLFQSI